MAVLLIENEYIYIYIYILYIIIYIIYILHIIYYYFYDNFRLYTSYRYNAEHYWTLHCFAAKNTGAATGGVLQKKLFIKKLHQFQRKAHILESHFNNVAGRRSCSFINNGLQHKCFPEKLVKFLRTPFLQNICEWLRLKISTLQKRYSSISFTKLWLS